MMKNLILCGAALMSLCSTAAVTLQQKKCPGNGNTLLEIKNPLLSVTIEPAYGGRIRSFIPAATNHEEVYLSTDLKGGFCEQLITGSSYNRELGTAANQYKIVKNTPQEVIVQCSYTITKGNLKGMEFQRTYSVKDNAAALGVAWTITNKTGKTQGLSPWMRNITTGYDQKNITTGKASLDSDSSIMLKCGAFRKTASGADTFLEPARNWFSRVPKAPAKDKKTVNFIFDYNEVFQFYTVHFKHLHTMELLFRYVELAPEKSWSGKFMVVSGGTLADVRFASTNAAADLVRKDGKLELSITSPRNIKDAELRLLDGKGTLIGKQNISITALETSCLKFNDVPGDIFELQLIKDGKDLMLDKNYLPKNVKMTTSLTSLHAKRRPEKFDAVLEPWKKDVPDFEAPKPRKIAGISVPAAKGLQVWGTDSLERVMEADTPAHAPVSGAVYNLAAAKAEREYFQLAVRNTTQKELKDFSLELACPAIKDLDLQWNILGYITTTRPSFGQKVIGNWPEVLDLDRSFAVKPGQTRAVWISLKVPRDTAAGTYVISVTLKRAGKIVAMLPVKLRVFDFELPKVPNLRTDAGRFFGDYHKMAQRYGFKGTRTELLDKLNTAILEHRMSPRGLVASRNNLKAYEADLIRHIKAGANVFAFPGTANSSLKTRQALEKIHAKHNVVHLSYVYAFDEIHSEQIPRVKQWCANWRKNHKIPILVVYYGGPVEPLYGSIDIWSRAHNPEDKKLIADRKGKDQFWHTNSSLYTMEKPWVRGRADLWKAYSAGMNGLLLWSVASWTNSPYIQTFRSGCNIHGVFFFPAPEGVRPGARWKVLSDAVDDFDYLCILRSEMEKARAAGKAPELVAAAEKLFKDEFFRSNDLTGSMLLKRRNDAGVLIEKFRNISR